MRDLDAHVNALAMLRMQLVAKHLVEEVQVGGLVSGGLSEHRVQTLRHMDHVQFLQALEYASVDEIGTHGATSPLKTAS